MIHRVVDSIADGLASGAQGFVSSVAGAVKGVGESVMRGLDKPFTDLTGKEGPHRIIDRAADGVVGAGINALNQGVIGSYKMLGEGLMKALDQPLEQVKGISEMKLPRMFKR